MRYRILASFQGAPYEAGVGPDESDVVLFAACPPPEELRFEPATGHWRKRVSRGQVQALYESRPVGMFRGERCIVLDDLNDRLHIVYLGHDALRAAELGYWEVDRGVFELITPRHEVTDIVEQRLPLSIRSDSGQHTRPGPMPSERPDDYGAAGGNGVSYSRTDSQPIEVNRGGHDEFATGPQLIDRGASLDGPRSSYSQDLPITAFSGPERSEARPADQSDVAIPLVPQAPLPLEAEALRAASSAVRRGQKGSQSRSAQDARVARRPHPTVEPQVQAAAGQADASQAAGRQDTGMQETGSKAQEPSVAPAPPAPPLPAPSPPVDPAQVPVEPALATGEPAQAAAPAHVAITQPEVRGPAAEVSQPLATPAPAAAMLSKAAMLSHAAATAARQAAASSKQSSQPTSATAASESATRSEHESRSEDPEQPGTPDRTTSLGPEPASQPAEPALLAPEPALLAPEPALLAPEPALLAPEQVGMPAMAVAAAPVGQPTDTAASLDQAATELLAADEPVDARADGHAEPGQDALSDMPAAAPAASAAPVTPEADSPPVLAHLVPSSPRQDTPTSPELAEAAPALAADATPAQSTPATAANADGNAGTPLVGISDPPSVAHPPAASAVPSWIPQRPVQPQADFDAVRSAEPTHDIASGQAGYYAPYVASEPVQHNGTATVNGTAAADYGLTAPVPIQQPNIPPMPPAQPERPQPTGVMSESVAEAEADPGATTRRRRGTKRRLPTQKIFSDLATQAAIPAAAYAIGEDVDGAMCLVRTDEGFEVFNAAAGARHEVRVFQDEESAYFYLFGVLVAESVRTGALVPRD